MEVETAKNAVACKQSILHIGLDGFALFGFLDRCLTTFNLYFQLPIRIVPLDPP